MVVGIGNVKFECIQERQIKETEQGIQYGTKDKRGWENKLGSICKSVWYFVGIVWVYFLFNF